jgi:IS5 family transposase
MRKILCDQVQIGEIDIGAVEIELDTRDEIPQLLRGLQHLYKTVSLRNRIFNILWQLIPDDVEIDTGRSGMDLWKIFVLGTLRLCCNWDYDKLQEIANNHVTLRQMLGHGLLDMNTRYPRQTLNDNLRWFTPEILDSINRIVVGAGHRVLGMAADQPLHARCDSFVVETDVHFPTDVNLLWDAVRKVLTLTHRFSDELGIPGFRQTPHHLRSVKRQFRIVQKLREKDKGKNTKSPECRAATKVYIDIVRQLLDRAAETIPFFIKGGIRYEVVAEEINRFIGHGKTLIDQIRRRSFKGEKIPHDEKIFSLFEPHTEWISKGKAGVSQELGLRVCILECSSGFVLHHMVMEQETDDQVAVPIIKEAKGRFGNLKSCSFDKGFHSPENQEKIGALLDFAVLPRKGKRTKEQQNHESREEFMALRRKHAAVESGLNALENHGLDRVLDRGVDAFKRYVALAVVARNIQLLGRKLQEKELERIQALHGIRKAA